MGVRMETRVGMGVKSLGALFAVQPSGRGVLVRELWRRSWSVVNCLLPVPRVISCSSACPVSSTLRLACPSPGAALHSSQKSQPHVGLFTRWLAKTITTNPRRTEKSLSVCSHVQRYPESSGRCSLPYFQTPSEKKGMGLGMGAGTSDSVKHIGRLGPQFLFWQLSTWHVELSVQNRVCGHKERPSLKFFPREKRRQHDLSPNISISRRETMRHTLC